MLVSDMMDGLARVSRSVRSVQDCLVRANEADQRAQVAPDGKVAASWKIIADSYRELAMLRAYPIGAREYRT